ncbi:MAG: arginine N-succinyltransferase, partial [Gammaproteobacteria bacterium]
MGDDQPLETTPKRRFAWLKATAIFLTPVIVTVAVAILVFRAYFYPSDFFPVTLNAKEERALSAKIERLSFFGAQAAEPDKPGGDRSESPPEQALEPEPYSEEGADRTIRFNEKELNALLAKNTDLARKLAIDLSEGLVSAKLLVPLEEDFPGLGGNTLKMRAGLGLAYDQGKPIVVLKGISIMGVPIPNAWLGGIKNIDLVKEFGSDQGFWKAFADGVENIHVAEGDLLIEL